MAKQTKKPVIKITKIFPPNKESVEKCHVRDHGNIECWFTVNGVKYVLHYNPKLAGYDGMPAEARENCVISREIDGKTQHRGHPVLHQGLRQAPCSLEVRGLLPTRPFRHRSRQRR